jgi:pimeloyl-ACP methyl ester carboxylesterase
MPVLDRILGDVITQLGVPQGKLGNVVFLPGILGSDLVDTQNDKLWILPPRFDRLRLASDGVHEDDPNRAVHATTPNFPHAALIHVLELSWNVLAFAYDWRRDIFESARLLERAITAKFHGAPFHIVAHSMGGLLARVLRANSPTIQRGGKLVMLATPNHGSFLAVQLLTVDTAASALLALFGVQVPPAIAMATARTWPGAYELLPCPFLDNSIQSLLSHPQAGLSANHLASARHFHEFLHRSVLSDAVYIGGNNVLTLDGEAETVQGDGVVSHRLGFLAGTETFIVPMGGHIDLLSNPIVLASITPLLHDRSHGLLLRAG